MPKHKQVLSRFKTDIYIVVVVATVVEDNFAIFHDIQLSDAIGIVQTRGVKLQAQGSLLAQKTLTSVP